MHFVTCDISLNGEHHTVVHRDEFHPVSWPEVEVLRFLHGEDAVRNVKPFVSVAQTAKDEKERLRFIYGNNVLENLFPGRNPAMELDAPGVKTFREVPWKNPIDGEESAPAKARPKEFSVSN